MEKFISKLILLVFSSIFLISFFIVINPIYALDPTTKELTYAKSFMKLHSQLALAQQDLNSKINDKIQKIKTCGELRQMLVSDYKQIKNYYYTLNKMAPPKQFINTHKQMINVTIVHLSLLKDMLVCSKQDYTVDRIIPLIEKLPTVEKNYQEAGHKFMIIVCQWPPDYSDQVRDASLVNSK